ncbi:MAG: hypothetical protein R3F35_20940 [Myxococcota bacterium]
MHDRPPARDVERSEGVDLVCIAVDWSGARGATARLALAEARDGRLERIECFRDRARVHAAIVARRRSAPRIVVGLDFSFSLPAWYVRRLGLDDAAALWRHVDAEGERWLQDCPWPFWGRPGRKRPDLETPLRRTESEVAARLKRIGPSPRPKSTFQIGGAGAVGTGSIRGMPHLSRLRAEGFAVWPFESAGRETVIELYPRALTGPVVKRRPASRAAHLASLRPRIPAALERTMIASEDAFDAGLAALAMSTCGAALLDLPSGDAVDRIEGRIWMPEERSAAAEATA